MYKPYTNTYILYNYKAVLMVGSDANKTRRNKQYLRKDIVQSATVKSRRERCLHSQHYKNGIHSTYIVTNVYWPFYCILAKKQIKNYLGDLINSIKV